MLAWLDTYSSIIAPLFMAGVVVFGCLIVWAVESSPVAPFFHRRVGIVAPFASIPSVLFSLIMAFTIQDTWGRHTRAEAAVTRETEAIRMIGTITHALGNDGAGLNRVVADYAVAATGDNWLNPPKSDQAEALLRRMMEETLFGHVAQANPQVQRAVLDAVSDIRNSRRDRMSSGDVRDATLKWTGAFFLGTLTLVAIALVHLGKPRASRLAAGLFGLALGFIAWTTLVRLDVFAGPNGISLAPIVAASQSSN